MAVVLPWGDVEKEVKILFSGWQHKNLAEKGGAAAPPWPRNPRSLLRAGGAGTEEPGCAKGNVFLLYFIYI